MRIVVTIYEETSEDALRSIREVRGGDMVELRAEKLGAIDFAALRAATSKPIILTHRGVAVDDATLFRALEAGIDFVDVEWRPDLTLSLPRERVVLSHHDYQGMSGEADAMRALGCAYAKLAVTPKTLDENLELLSIKGITVIGMGERGLYSRILAPFFGSELAFVGNAAPGQISLEKALAIYGDPRENLSATHVFAIAGNPAGHSLSPTIHNPLFREKGVDAAYTIASFETFAEIADAFERGDIRGLSITAPFEE